MFHNLKPPNRIIMRYIIPTVSIFAIIVTCVSIAVFIGIPTSMYIVYVIWIVSLLILYFILPGYKSKLFINNNKQE